MSDVRKLIDAAGLVGKAANAAAKAALHAVDCAKDTDRCCREAVAAYADRGYCPEGGKTTPATDGKEGEGEKEKDKASQGVEHISQSTRSSPQTPLTVNIVRARRVRWGQRPP